MVGFKSIYDAESAVQQDSKSYNDQQVRSHLEELVNIAKNREINFVRDIYRALQEQLLE